MASGVLASCMSLGGVIAPIVASSLRIDCGLSWQAVYMALALPGIAWAIAYFWWFRDRPEAHPRVNAEEIEIIRGVSPAAADQPDLKSPRLRRKMSRRRRKRRCHRRSGASRKRCRGTSCCAACRCG